MRRTAPILATLLVVVGVLAAGTTAGLAQSDATPAAAGGVAQADDNRTANETADEIPPGERLSAVTSVQQAEIGGELQSRALGIQVASAATAEGKADVLARQQNASETRLATLARERDRLREARNNGSISQSEYRTRTATLAAETGALNRLLDQTGQAAAELSAAQRERAGVTATALQRLRERADRLGGSEVSATARAVVGSSAAVSTSGTRITANVTGGGAANASFQRAEATLERAHTAAEQGDAERARDLAGRASTEAESALSQAGEALAAAWSAGTSTTTPAGTTAGTAAGSGR